MSDKKGLGFSGVAFSSDVGEGFGNSSGLSCNMVTIGTF